MRFEERIKKNQKLHYLLKAYKHRNDKEYVEFFLNRETNPILLEFLTKGNMYPDKRFFVIRENGKGWGFFAEFRAMLAKLIFAERFCMTPYIDWGKDFLYSEEQEINHTMNAFEYYFLQPGTYKKSDIDCAKYVTFSKSAQGEIIEKEYVVDNNICNISYEYESVLAEMYRKYIRFNATTEQRINQEISTLIQGKSVLGVHYRGTDYKVGYNLHPVYVKMEQVVEEVKIALDKYSFEKIFLATDEIAAVERFKSEFGDKVLVYNDVYRGETEVSIAFSQANRANHHYRLGYEVIRDMYTLSVCTGLIAGMSQVTNIARVAKRARKEEYKYFQLINNGLNHNECSFKSK